MLVFPTLRLHFLRDFPLSMTGLELAISPYLPLSLVVS